MENQKIIRKLQRSPDIDPIEFLKTRNWKMTGIEIENVLTQVIGRLPTKQEVLTCRPNDEFIKKQKVYKNTRYGKL